MVSPSIEPGKDPGKAKITGTVPAKPGQLAAMLTNFHVLERIIGDLARIIG